MSQDGVGCKDCKRVREYVAALFFIVHEAMSGKFSFVSIILKHDLCFTNVNQLVWNLNTRP